MLFLLGVFIGYLVCIWTLPIIVPRAVRWISRLRFRRAMRRAKQRQSCDCEGCSMVRLVTEDLALQGQLIREPWERTGGGEA